MLTNWWYPPDEGNKSSARSSTDDGRIDPEDDTQLMEPDQGNGELSPFPSKLSSFRQPMHAMSCCALSYIPMLTIRQCSRILYHSCARGQI